MAATDDPDLPKELLEYLDAREKAAFASGYAAAKRELLKTTFARSSAQPAGVVAPQDSAVTSSVPQVPVAAIPLPPSERRPRSFSLAKGMPEMLIEAAYKSIAPSHASPIQIAEEVKRSTGTALPGSSLHRVIHRLEERGIIERVGTTSAWRYAQKDGREPANPSGGVVVDLGKRGVQ